MADLTATKQELEKTLLSLGIDTGAGNDADLRAASLSILNELNQMFGNKKPITDYDSDAITVIQDGLKEHFHTTIDGSTRLEDLKAIRDKDVDFLVQNLEKPFWYIGSEEAYREEAKIRINEAYAQNANSLPGALTDIVDLGDKDDTKALIALIKDKSSFLKSDASIQASIALIENPEVLFSNLAALNENGFYAEKVDANALKAMDKGTILSQNIALIEQTIGVAAPDGAWGDEDKAQLKKYVGALQQHAYFGKGLSPEETQALPDDLRTMSIYAAGGSPDSDWRPSYTDATLGPQAFDNKKDGVWDYGFKLQLAQRVTLLGQELAKQKAEDPLKTPEFEGLTEDDYQTYGHFIQTMGALEERDVELLPKEDQLTTAQATRNVEAGLMLMVPMLNGALKEALDKAESKGRDFENSAIGNIIGQVTSFLPAGAGGGISSLINNATAFLKQPITEIDKADTHFGFESQRALQGLMTVLSNPHVLDIKDPVNANGEFFYTAEKGQFILDTMDAAFKEPDKAPQFLKDMSAEQREMLKAMVESGKLEEFITSLNVLSKNDTLLNYNVIKDKGFARITQDIVKDEITRLETDVTWDNPGQIDAVHLFDTLLYSYTGGKFGVNDILDGHNIQGDEDKRLLNKGLEPARDDEGHAEKGDDDKLSAQEKYTKRLAKFYDSTQKRLSAQDVDSDAFFLVMLNSFKTLPFGSDLHKDMFRSRILDALKNNEDGTPKTGVEFAEAVNKAMADMRELHGDVTMNNRRNVDVQIHPKLRDFEPITSNGTEFKAEDIMRTYNDVQLGEGIDGQRRDISNQHRFTFRDDDGAAYVAGVDAASMIFTIEKVTEDQLKMMDKYLNDEKIDGKEMSMDDRIAHLQKNSPAFALIYPPGNYAALTTLPYKTFYEHISDVGESQMSVRPFSDIQEKYENMANGVRENSNTVKYEPLIGGGTTRDVSATVKSASEAFQESAGRHPQGAEMSTLFSLAGDVKGAARIIDDKATMALLKEFDGRKDLRLGHGPAGRGHLRISGVSIAQNPNNEPMVAYYDKVNHTINLTPVNEDLAKHVATDTQGRRRIPAHLVQEQVLINKSNKIRDAFNAPKPEAAQATPSKKAGLSEEFDKTNTQAQTPAQTLGTDTPVPVGITADINKPL